MNSSSDSSSDSDFDPAELQKLKDAAFEVTDLFSAKPVEKCVNLKDVDEQPLKTYRGSCSQKQFDNELGVSEEFRQHVARKLAESVDDHIVFTNRLKNQENKSAEPDIGTSSGFRLFSTSDPDWHVSHRPLPRKRCQSTSSSSSSELDKCASIAVSANWILAQSQPTQEPYTAVNSNSKNCADERGDTEHGHRAKRKKKKKKLQQTNNDFSSLSESSRNQCNNGEMCKVKLK
jgi:hypothetical protein